MGEQRRCLPTVMLVVLWLGRSISHTAKDLSRNARSWTNETLLAYLQCIISLAGRELLEFPLICELKLAFLLYMTHPRD